MKVSASSILVAAGFVLVTCFQNCADVEFGMSSEAASKRGFCANVEYSAQKTVKFVLLIDESGSNDTSKDGRPATDPNKLWRSSAISGLVQRYPVGGKLQYEFVGFSGGSARSMSKGNQSEFIQDPVVVQRTIDKFLSHKDEGSTPYEAAIATAKGLIQADRNSSASDDVFYVVVMMTDGFPSNNSFGTPAEFESTRTHMMERVDEVVRVSPERISFNTVFYHPENHLDQKASELLASMASVGKGEAISAVSNQSLDLTRTFKVFSELCK